MKNIISLGAGVQSSTMALMAAHGEILPFPDEPGRQWEWLGGEETLLAVFADTGWEPAAVYRWLAWLVEEVPFPVKVVSKGNIRDEQILYRTAAKADRKGRRFAAMPYFVDTGGPVEGRAKRQCTSEYKIEPIELFLRREILGLAKGQRGPKTPSIWQWRGISSDEISRMKDASAKWYKTRFPLAMEHRMSRADCLGWMRAHGYPEPPRSACIGCPFHSDTEWRRIRDETPDEWEDAVAFDAQIRRAHDLRGVSYLHRSLVPLSEVDLNTPEDKGQYGLFGNFGDECEGMCGI